MGAWSPTPWRVHRCGVTRPGGTTGQHEPVMGEHTRHRPGDGRKPRPPPHRQDETAPQPVRSTTPTQGNRSRPNGEPTRHQELPGNPEPSRPQRNPTPTQARSRPRTATGQASPPLRHAPTQRNVIHKYTVGQLHPEFLRSIRTGTGVATNFDRPGRSSFRHRKRPRKPSRRHPRHLGWP